MTERFTTLSSTPLHSGSELRRYHEVKSPLFQLPLHHNNARFQYIYRFQRVEVLTRFCGKRRLCDRIFALFGIVHCVAFRQKRNAMRPEVRGSSL